MTPSLWTHISSTMDREWLESIKGSSLVLHIALQKLIDHLKMGWDTVDNYGIAENSAKLMEPWTVNVNPASKARDDKIKK